MEQPKPSMWQARWLALQNEFCDLESFVQVSEPSAGSYLDYWSLSADILLFGEDLAGSSAMQRSTLYWTLRRRLTDLQARAHLLSLTCETD